MARTVLLNLLGVDNTGRAFRSAAQEADRTADSVDRLNASSADADGSSGRLTSTLARLAPAAGQAAASIGLAAAGLGAAVPAAAGLTATLVAIAPAAAVAATSIAAIGLAGAALKIGMSGVGDAISAAMDPSDPAAYAAALEKLTPAAREFVGAVKEMQPALAGIKTAVQESLFDGLGQALTETANDALPVVRRGLVDAAEAMNGMGKNLLASIREVARDGSLRTMFDGATNGLKNLTRVPGQLLKGFVQVGAAAAPVFERMTAGIARGFDRLSQRMARSFEGGGMTAAIETAVGLLRQLAQVGRNVGQVLGNIFGAAQASGGGFVGTLQTITGMLAQVTANPAFQQGLQALFQTMNLLATTAAPLLGQALAAIGPIVAALQPAFQVLIEALGQALQPIIAALGPVLLQLAQTFGQLVIAIAPLLPPLGQLIAAILPLLIPPLQLLAAVFTALAPVIEVVAGFISATLVPAVTALLGPVQTAVDWLTNLAQDAFPAVANAANTIVGPALNTLKDAFGKAKDAITPLVDGVMKIVNEAIPPLSAALDAIGGVLKDTFAGAIDNVVMPALNTLTGFLEGDASAAFQKFSGTAKQSGDEVSATAKETNSNVQTWLRPMIKALGEIGRDAMTALRNAVREGAKDLLVQTALIPMRVVASLGNLGGLLVAAGRNLMSGFLAGIRSMMPSLDSLLESITLRVPMKKGPPAKDRVLLRPAGQLVMEGFVAGIDDGIAPLEQTLAAISGLVAKSFDATHGTIVKMTGEIRKGLLGSASEIDTATKKIADGIREAFKQGDIGKGSRDSLLDFLADSNANLKSLTEQRMAILDKIREARDFARKMTEEAINYASIVNIKGSGDNGPTGAELLAGLQARLGTIRAFAANIKKLGEAGLSKTILAQILDAGIEGGAAIAEELANGPNSIIVALNSTQKQIDKVAKKLGLDSADLLFDSGKNAGTGFLKGLESTEKELLAAMRKIVKTLVDMLDDGIAKLKAKAAEAAQISAGISDYTGPAVKAAPSAPSAPKPAPKPSPKASASVSGLNSKTVNLNMGPTTIRESADAGAVMNRAAFAARSLAF